MLNAMAGGEMVPVVAMAATAGKKLLSDGDDKKQLQKLAADSPGMKAAAATYGRRVAVKQAFLLRLFQPLARLVGVSREYFDTDFATDMAKKLADISDEDLT